jgi:hypothetical protein
MINLAEDVMVYLTNIMFIPLIIIVIVSISGNIKDHFKWFVFQEKVQKFRFFCL